MCTNRKYLVKDTTLKAPSTSTICSKGYEFKSKAKLFGIPLLHISFRRENKKPVPAKGIIAIGQFAAGVVTISQFGIGIINISQFSIGYMSLAQIAIAQYAVAQIAIAYDGIAQIGWFLKDYFF